MAGPGVLTNAFWLALVALVVGMSRFGTNWWIAAHYGAAEHGRFAVVFQLISAVIVVCELGIASAYGVRQIAAARDAATGTLGRLINGLAVSLLVVHGLALCVVLGVALPWTERFGISAALLTPAAFWLIGFAFYRVSVMVATGCERAEAALAATLLFYGAWIFWLIVGTGRGVSLAALATGWAWTLPVGGLLACGVVTPMLHRRGVTWRMGGTRSVASAVPLILQAVPYGLPVVGTLLVPGILCLLSAWARPAESVSHFQICYAMAILANLAAQPLGAAVLARWSRGHLAGDMPSGTELNRAVRLSGGVAIIALGLHAMAGAWLLGRLGAGYAAEVNLLIGLAAVISLDAVRVVMDHFLLAIGRVRRVAWAEGGRLAVLVMAGVPLVHVHGPMGAVIALAMATILNTVLKTGFVTVAMGAGFWAPVSVVAATSTMALLLPRGWPVAVICAVAVILLSLLKPPVRRSSAGPPSV